MGSPGRDAPQFGRRSHHELQLALEAGLLGISSTPSLAGGQEPPPGLPFGVAAHEDAAVAFFPGKALGLPLTRYVPREIRSRVLDRAVDLAERADQ